MTRILPTHKDTAWNLGRFTSLECELIDRTRFATRHEADLAVIDYIEGFYNTRQRHSALDYRSPIDYENDAASEAA